jgi:hypothetical protein
MSSTAQGLQLNWHQRQYPLLHKEEEGTVESGLSAIFDIMACNDMAELAHAKECQRKRNFKEGQHTLREYKLKLGHQQLSCLCKMRRSGLFSVI